MKVFIQRYSKLGGRAKNKKIELLLDLENFTLLCLPVALLGKDSKILD